MRIMMVTSFPIPGEYDGTAMLPIKILRALKARGIEVVLAHLRARPPWGRSERTDFEGTPSFTFSPAGASVYQLGTFGTARKELKALTVAP